MRFVRSCVHDEERQRHGATCTRRLRRVNLHAAAGHRLSAPIPHERRRDRRSAIEAPGPLHVVHWPKKFHIPRIERRARCSVSTVIRWDRRAPVGRCPGRRRTAVDTAARTHDPSVAGSISCPPDQSLRHLRCRHATVPVLSPLGVGRLGILSAGVHPPPRRTRTSATKPPWGDPRGRSP